MKLNVLGIGGSPRRNGNTDRLLNQAMDTLKHEGYATQTIYIRDLNYSLCKGCNACSKKGECVQKDDIQLLQEQLLAADRIIVAAPVFFMGINAQMKAVIDRMQPYWAMKYVLKKPIIQEPNRILRRGLFLSAAATHFPDVFDCAERSIKNLFHVLEIKYYGACLFRGIDKAGEIEHHPNALKEVHDKVLDFVSS